MRIVFLLAACRDMNAEMEHLYGPLVRIVNDSHIQRELKGVSDYDAFLRVLTSTASTVLDHDNGKPMNVRHNKPCHDNLADLSRTHSSSQPNRATLKSQDNQPTLASLTGRYSPVELEEYIALARRITLFHSARQRFGLIISLNGKPISFAITSLHISLEHFICQ